MGEVSLFLLRPIPWPWSPFLSISCGSSFYEVSPFSLVSLASSRKSWHLTLEYAINFPILKKKNLSPEYIWYYPIPLLSKFFKSVIYPRHLDFLNLIVRLPLATWVVLYWNCCPRYLVIAKTKWIFSQGSFYISFSLLIVPITLLKAFYCLACHDPTRFRFFLGVSSSSVT